MQETKSELDSMRLHTGYVHTALLSDSMSTRLEFDCMLYLRAVFSVCVLNDKPAAVAGCVQPTSTAMTKLQ